MRDLRTIRIFLTVVFFAAALVYLFIGSGVTPMASVAVKVQIIPSALGMTMGATGFWLVATFMLGRVYCSTVCPVGALQDSASWLRRRLWRVKRLRGVRFPWNARRVFAPYSYRERSRFGGMVLLAYAVCLLLGMITLASLLEPWNMMRSAARLTNPEADAGWLILAGRVATGGAIGMAVLLAIWLIALADGRFFCTEICPVGTVLGAVSRFSFYHIEIDPDRCTNCMRCEGTCKSRCIHVAERIVDNERCVRCFDCLKVCADDAIRLQRNRNQRATPLLNESK